MYIAKINEDQESFTVKCLRSKYIIDEDGNVTVIQPDVPKDWIEISDMIASKPVYADELKQPCHVVPDHILNYDALAAIKAATTYEELQLAIIAYYE